MGSERERTGRNRDRPPGKEPREKEGRERAAGLVAVAPLGNERQEAEPFVQRFIGWFFVQVFTQRGDRARPRSGKGPEG